MVAIALLQSFFALCTCVGLYVLWQRVAKEGIAVPVVAAGFLARAGLSTILFWVSWLELPLAKSLQLGEGLWFFGLDGRGYFLLSDRLLADGALGILKANETDPAYLYVQLIALSQVLFGSVVSVALLVNLASFLATALLIAMWGRRTGKPRNAALSLLGLSVSPSLILWSTQPLKDTLFTFLVVAFVVLVALLIEPRWEHGISLHWVLAGLAATTWAMAGVRWLQGVVLLVLLAPAILWPAIVSRGARSRHLWWALGGFVAIALVLVERLPGTLMARLAWVARLPSSVAQLLGEQRVSFEQSYQPTTIIEAGPLLDWLPDAVVFARGLLMFLPRFVADSFGLATAHGGRGLWLFAELDTVVFMAIGVAVARILWRSRPLERGRLPLMAFIVGMFVASLPMLYVVNNFGTLFRMRLMLLLPILLLPLAVPDRSSVETAEREP